jgi:hypothetical protein
MKTPRPMVPIMIDARMALPSRSTHGVLLGPSLVATRRLKGNVWTTWVLAPTLDSGARPRESRLVGHEMVAAERREALRELARTSEVGQYTSETGLRASRETLDSLVAEGLAHRGTFPGPRAFFILTARGLKAAGPSLLTSSARVL